MSIHLIRDTSSLFAILKREDKLCGWLYIHLYAEPYRYGRIFSYDLLYKILNNQFDEILQTLK